MSDTEAKLNTEVKTTGAIIMGRWKQIHSLLKEDLIKFECALRELEGILLTITFISMCNYLVYMSQND